MKTTRRYFPIEDLRAIAPEPDKKPVIKGHAAVFNQRSEDLGGWSSWYEIFEPGAFADTIRSDEIHALLNHNDQFVLGRSKNGTLRLSEDAVGLSVEIDPPGTQWANDLLVSIGRGDIHQMSIGFTAVDERWEKKDGLRLRYVSKAKLFDVSPVTFPAYPQTDVQVDGRSLEVLGLNPKSMFRILQCEARNLGIDPEDHEEIRKIINVFTSMLPGEVPDEGQEAPDPQVQERLMARRRALVRLAEMGH